MYPITTLTTSFLALVYIYLSIQVIKLRHKHKVSLGSKNHTKLEMTIRAHGNFGEYVPLTLLLILCSEANKVNWIVLLILVFLFILGRAFHGYAFLNEKNHFKFRFRGMVCTFVAIACIAFLNLALMSIKLLK